VIDKENQDQIHTIKETLEQFVCVLWWWEAVFDDCAVRR
jgi:hypothetical protein